MAPPAEAMPGLQSGVRVCGLEGDDDGAGSLEDQGEQALPIRSKTYRGERLLSLGKGKMREDAGQEVFTPRAKRALALIGLAFLALGGSAGVSLWRSADHPYNGPAPPSASRPVLVSMTAISERRAWVVVHDSGGPESFLFQTEDGGAHWRRQLSIIGVGVVRFADARRGVLLNYPVEAPPEAGVPRAYVTSDAGASWHPATMPRLTPGFNSVPFFLDPEVGWVLGTRAAPYGGGVAEEITLQRTRDGGRHWEQLLSLDSSSPADHGVSVTDYVAGLNFVDQNTGWMVTWGAAGSSAVYVTHDGGRNWSRTSTAPALEALGRLHWLYLGEPFVSADGHGMMSVFDRDANQVWVLRTPDGGGTWAGLQPVPTFGPLNLAFVDGSAGWVANGLGAWVTSDSGASWLKSAPLPGGMALGDVAPVSASVAWAQGLPYGAQSNPIPWKLYRTTDGGRHWTPAAVPALG
jgi:photosystem II stability/assembly factor-like uncharacterized protein